MTYRIPSADQRRFTQTNRGDFSGNIRTTKNINFDYEGYLQLSAPAVAIMTEDDDSDFDRVDAMAVGEGVLFMNGDEVFHGTIGVDKMTSDAGDTNAPSPAVENDILYFNDAIVVTDGITVDYSDSATNPTTWTNIAATTISAGAPTCLALFDGQSGLMIGNGNKVDLINTSWGLIRTLTLPTQYNVSSMVSNGSVAYIGTRHKGAGEARMFIWDGNGTSASESYGVENFEIPSIKAYGSSVVAFTSDGRKLRFNGGGFDELAVLPVYNETNVDWGDDGNDYSVLANRGMAVDGNLSYINIASELESYQEYLPNFYGGVWCFDPSVGLYHRHSPSFTTLETIDISSVDKVDTSTNIITVTADIPTGTPILYSSTSTLLDPLKLDKSYYAINVSATEIRLAESIEAANAGTAIDLETTGHTSNKLHVYHVKDYGNTYTDNRCSLAVLSQSMRNALYAERLAFSANVDNETGSEKTVLNTPNPQLYNRGHFILPKLVASQKEDKFHSIEFKHLPLGTDDEIRIKYRVIDDPNYPLDFKDDGTSLSDRKGTWTSTTTFTTDRDISSAQVGDEVDIVGGVGAGTLSHITDISESSGTYTVTIDEAFAFAESGNEMYFVIDNWKFLGTINSTNEITGFRLDEAVSEIEFKVELRGIKTTIIEVMINNKIFKPQQ